MRDAGMPAWLGKTLPSLKSLVTRARSPLLERPVVSFAVVMRWPFLAHASRPGLVRFLGRRFGGSGPVSALQLMKQRRCNVGRAEALFEQSLDELVLPFEVAALERRADLVQYNIGPRCFHLVNRRRARSLNSHIRVALDVANLEHLASRGE